MKRVVVVLGSTIGSADRAALSLAIHRFGGAGRCLCTSESAWRYGAAAGMESAWLEEPVSIDFDIALTGGMGDLLPARMAEARGGALVLDVLDVTSVGDHLEVTRDLGRGAQEILTVTVPVVLAIDDGAPNRLYVSRHRRRMVTAPPAAPVSDATAEASWQTVRPRTRGADLATRTAGSANERMATVFGLSGEARESDDHVIRADGRTCAQHLVRYLSHHGFIERGKLPEPLSPAGSDRQSDVATPEPEGGASSGQAVPERIGRGPRPVDGQAVGMSRRPVPVSSRARGLGKLARGPRPVGQPRPSHSRGPYKVGEDHG